MGLSPRDHVSSALLELHWLPVSIIINLGLNASSYWEFFISIPSKKIFAILTIFLKLKFCLRGAYRRNTKLFLID